MASHRPNEVEDLITMASREYAAEVGVTSQCFGEENSSVIFVNQFSTEDRLQTSLSCHVEKPNRSIQPVCIGEGQRVMGLCPNSLAERFQRWDALHRGIG